MAIQKKNTGKAPSVQFYYKDFLADMSEHPPEIVGAWMLVLIKIWHAKSNGEITRSVTQLSLIMHVTENKALEYLRYFDEEGIGDVSGVTDGNGYITVVNRRAKRDANLLEQNRLRQQAFRGKHESNGKNGESNGDVTGEKRNPSSSSSSSASTKKVLFPIPGKMCGKRGCGMPAVYKDTAGDYDQLYCAEHMPEKVKAQYVG